MSGKMANFHFSKQTGTCPESDQSVCTIPQSGIFFPETVRGCIFMIIGGPGKVMSLQYSKMVGGRQLADVWMISFHHMRLHINYYYYTYY